MILWGGEYLEKNRLISKRNNFQLIISFFWNPGSFPSSSVHFWCSYFDFLSQVDSNCGKFCIKCHKGPVERASPNDVPMFSEIPARRHDYEQMGFRKRFFVFFSKKQKKHIGQNSAKLFVFTNYGLLFWLATKWLIFHNKLNEGSKTSFGRFNGPTKKQGDDGIVTVSCGKEFKKKHIKEIWTLTFSLSRLMRVPRANSNWIRRGASPESQGDEQHPHESVHCTHAFHGAIRSLGDMSSNPKTASNHWQLCCGVHWAWHERLPCSSLPGTLSHPLYGTLQCCY